MFLQPPDRCHLDESVDVEELLSFWPFYGLLAFCDECVVLSASRALLLAALRILQQAKETGEC
jgi:hypothetical protein